MEQLRPESMATFGTPLMSNTSADLSDSEYELLAEAQRTVDRNVPLFNWWVGTGVKGRFRRRIEISPKDPRNESFLFFEEVEIDGRNLQAMGSFQTLHTGRTVGSQELRDLVSIHFLRMAAPGPPSRDQQARWRGFVYTQKYFKRRQDGALGRFFNEGEPPPVTLDEIKRRYEWIVLDIDLGDLAFRPFERTGLCFKLPLQNHQLVVLVPELFAAEESGHGLGYVPFRKPGQRTLLAHGPGRLDTGFQHFTFQRSKSGELLVCLVFLTKRVEKILELRSGIDPLVTTLDLINRMTLGWAERVLGISRRGFEENMLRFHGRRHREMLTAFLEQSETTKPADQEP